MHRGAVPLWKNPMGWVQFLASTDKNKVAGWDDFQFPGF